MTSKTLQLYFLGLLTFITVALAFFIFRPFLITLVLAGVFAVVLQPLYQATLMGMKSSPGAAAFLTICVAFVCLLIPLAFIGVEVTRDAEVLYANLASGGVSYIQTVLAYVQGEVARWLPFALPAADLSATVGTYLEQGLTWLTQNVGGALSSLANLFVKTFIFLFALYYFLRDGGKLKHFILEASPLSNQDDQLIADRLALAINSVIRGSLTIALVQGVLTAVGFAIFGIPNSILWGVIAALMALVPAIGTSLVLIPGIIYLAITGATGAALGLLIWSIVVVGLIDNLLGPRLVSRGMQIHPLIILLSVFGGLTLFGPAGVFLGPLTASFLFALLSLYPRLKAAV